MTGHARPGTEPGTQAAAPHTIGEPYLSASEIAARVAELGGEITRDYAGLEPLLVAPLKASVVLLADLSRTVRIHHGLDVIELAAYRGGGSGTGVRMTKDLDASIAGRHVLVVEDVVDTGLTLAFVMRTLRLREPASLAALTLLDRPNRRLVQDIGLRYVGFTVPDELFAGYGLGLDERWRALPDLHLVVAEALPPAAADAA